MNKKIPALCKPKKNKPVVTMEDKVLHLLKTRWLTVLDALNLAGCLSLSQRVSEWIASGLNIQKKWVDLPNGKRVRAYKWVV